MPVLRPPLVVVLLAGCGAGPAAAPTTPAASTEATAASGSGPDGCYTEDELVARAAELASESDARYREALASQGLEPIALPIRSWPVERLEPPPDERVVVRDGERWLLAGSVGVACGALSEPFLLARAGSSVHLVERRVAARRIELPACPPTECSPAPAPGGCGTAPMPTGVAYVLPDGLDFGGDRTVDVESFLPTPVPVGPSPCPPTIRPPARP